MADEGGGDVVEGGKGEYVRLGGGGREDVCVHDGEEDGDGCCTPRRVMIRKWRGCVWYWVKLVFLLTLLGMVAAACVKWVWPYLMNNIVFGPFAVPALPLPHNFLFSPDLFNMIDVIMGAVKPDANGFELGDIIPVLNWERTMFSTPVLAVLVVASLAIFPSILLPSSPSMWVAGMSFGYGYGFLLCISGMSVGVSIPYFIGSLFYHKIQGWMDKYPKRASLIRSAGGGNWFHQFRSVTLIRISPFPYMIYNYCAVATNVKFGPYFLGSLVGVVPEIFVTMYTGILIKALADASHDRRALSAPEIIFNILGFLLTVSATLVFTIYAKRKLKALQKEDEPLQE